MVKHLSLCAVILLGGCALTDTTNRPDLVEPEQEVLDLDLLELPKFASFPYPDTVQSIVKSAPVLRAEKTENGTIYTQVDESTPNSEPRYIVLSTEQAFLIRDLFVAARENKKLADELIRINELSVEERNQLLRILKAEAYRIKRMESFNKYYKEELKRVETQATFEVWATRVLAALALLVAV